MMKEDDLDYYDQLPRMIKEMIWDYLPSKKLFQLRIVSSLWRSQIENLRGKNIRKRFEEFSNSGQEYQNRMIKELESKKDSLIKQYQSNFPMVGIFIDKIILKSENKRGKSKTVSSLKKNYATKKKLYNKL